MNKYFYKHNSIILIGIAILIPFLFSFIDLLRGNISFWYDPARDFISAFDNLHKPTLIGPTTGIPGLYYGPYWIWLVSLGLLLAKDPRVVIFVILTIPYFIIFPYLLFKFKKLYGLLPVVCIWLLFAINFGRFYANQPWNPHLAPLLFLLLFSLLFFTDFTKKRSVTKVTILTGFVSGLLINFHWSLGATLLIGTWIFFISNYFLLQKQRAIGFFFYKGLYFFTGFAIAFFPFFLFEVRHGFAQTKVILNLITTSVPIVGVTGLTDVQIIEEFFKGATQLLQIPAMIGYLILFGATLFFSYQIATKKVSFNEHDKKLVVLLLSFTISILGTYLLAKNPVWDYHFLGTEILFIFFILILAARSAIVRILLVGWSILFVIFSIYSFIELQQKNPLATPSLFTKEYITEKIIADAGNTNYVVYAYNPAIYSYDYAYLFMVRDITVPWDPGNNTANSEVIYLIIPQVKPEIKNDFIQYRSSDTMYRTEKTWQIPDGTTIIKRSKN